MAVIKVDWTIFLQAANFMVLMLVLNIILYRPLRDILVITSYSIHYTKLYEKALRKFRNRS